MFSLCTLIPFVNLPISMIYSVLSAINKSGVNFVSFMNWINANSEQEMPSMVFYLLLPSIRQGIFSISGHNICNDLRSDVEPD